MGNVIADGPRRQAELILSCGETLMPHHGLKNPEQAQIGRQKADGRSFACHTMINIIVKHETKSFFILSVGCMHVPTPPEAVNKERDMLKKLIGITAFASALALASYADAGTLKIGHSTWVGYGPFYIARDKGFFKE